MVKIKFKKSDLKSNQLVTGLVGGLTALTCCIAPLVLIVLGAGTAIGMMIMKRFHYVSVISGFLFVILISFYSIKKRTGKCNVNSVKQNWKSIFFAFLFMFSSLYILNNFVIEPIAIEMYGNLEIIQTSRGNMVDAMVVDPNMNMGGMSVVVPENEGMKNLTVKVGGIFCGSCGPGLEYDIKSVLGVQEVTRDDEIMNIIYDSDITNKKVILENIHEPYTYNVLEEKNL